eukprot:GHVT01082508.1.p2 GENE.GHVT01082508.1~~GHVT01082508.1.p2  ORF type:complete len:298 (+),score=10.12 GHVT01082508.1:1339-2232(+)
MDSIKNDIPRGNWTQPNDEFKKLLHSVDWEREYPQYHDQNYYKRNAYEGCWGDLDQTEDCYWDPQFIGAPETFPRTAAVGMNITWNINWVPWLCMKHPRDFGQPIKSRLFNLGGIEPLQIWFYPDGTAGSMPGYCAMKLVSRPGWRLPFPITISIGSEYSQIRLGPVQRDDAEYVRRSLNLCRLLDKQAQSHQEFNPREDVILGPAGNVFLTVGVGDPNWEWDDGAWDMEQYLKRLSSALPDDDMDEELSDYLATYTHSDHYENFKYRYVPDKHFARYLPSQVAGPSAKTMPVRHPF